MYRGTYTLIGSELSMFTRKLEAQLRYQKIPHIGNHEIWTSYFQISWYASQR